jgi:iron complex transport system permease protein
MGAIIRAVAAESGRADERPRSPAWTLGLLVLTAVAAFVFNIGVGSGDVDGFFVIRLSPSEVLRELLRGDLGGADANNAIVWAIRLPRALACVLVGGILGAVGSAFQALFRNPLADPFIVGVSSGAAVGGALSILLGFGAWGMGLGLLATSFGGGMASLALVFVLARHRGVVDVQTLLLAGVVVGSMLTAVLTLVLFASGADANQVLRWMLGSTTPMYWNRLVVLAAVLTLGGAVLVLQTKRLNAFAVGEETAQRLGVNTRRLRGIVLVVGTVMAAAAVGSVGVIGFLGLVAPHIARRLVGVDWRSSLVASAVCGMGLLLLSDVAAQRIVPGAELNVGVVTALIGAPFLLTLMRRQGA